MNSLCSNGCRIAKCMKEYFIFKRNYKGALSSTLLAKSLHQKLWDDSPYLLKQLPGIGMVTAKALHSMGVNSFESLAEADPRKIEIVTGRKYPFGNHIKESLLSLPPKVEMTMKKTNFQRQGKSTIMVTLTRLSHPVQTTKRHYADMIIGVDEDNLILFHEKIRVDEFSSPYSATVLCPSPQQVETSVKSDLIFEEFIGMDIHQKVTITNNVDFSNIQKTSIRQPFSYQPNDVCVIEDDNPCPAQLRAEEHQGSNKSKKEADSMPSFKLLDEDSDEGAPALANEDDECKIISEKGVFDHIREKGKNLPNLAQPNIVCSPSSETLNLIRKRTRERQVNKYVDLEESGRREVAFPDSDFQSIKPVELEEECNFGQDLTPNRYRSPINNNCFRATGNDPPEPKVLTGETIFEHIRRKANSFITLDNLKTNEFKSLNLAPESYNNGQSDNSTLASNGIEPMDRFQAPQENVTVLDPNGKRARTILSRSHTLETNKGMTTTQQAPSCKCDQLKGVEALSPTSLILESVTQQGKSSTSPSFLNRKSCGLATAGESKHATSFLGLKSVFSFL